MNTEFNSNQAICRSCQSVVRKKRYLDRRDEERSKVKEWQSRNTRKRVVSARNRNKGLVVTEEEWQSVIVKYGDKCLKCGSSPVTRDHVVPLSKGGKDHVDNLQPLCGPCNSAKGTKSTDYRRLTCSKEN